MTKQEKALAKFNGYSPIALKLLEEEKQKAQNGQSEYDLRALNQIEYEVRNMIKAKNPEIFAPGYGRAMMDMPIGDSEFKEILLELEYFYMKGYIFLKLMQYPKKELLCLMLNYWLTLIKISLAVYFTILRKKPLIQ